MVKQAYQEKNPIEDRSLRFLKGVGPERFRLLKRLGVETIQDLMYLFPRRYEDRSDALPIRSLSGQKKELVVGVVAQKRLIFRRGGQSIFRLIVEDSDSKLSAVWFNSPYMDKVFLVGQKVALFGKAEKEGLGFQMVHPDHEILQADGKRVHTGRIVPVYPLTQDLSQRNLRNLQYELLLAHLKELRDPLPPASIARLRVAPRQSAMKSIHFPKTAEELDAAYRRLVFDEFLVIQLALTMNRQAKRAVVTRPGAVLSPKILEDFSGLLPFELTEGQKKAIEDVRSDLNAGSPMHRLLQGDVGSGKTTVAAFALYAAARSGRQGALMAPTEILAQQHYLTLSRLLSAAGFRVGLLCQGQSEEERARTLAEISGGECAVLVGTHALIQSDIHFRDLAVCVVDEQHKFGVMQRKLLQNKSASCHVLVMTATPIPRTLAMTLYGDLDVSVMQDAPKGRGRVETLWVDEKNREAIYAFVEEELAKGRQAFFVSPLVEKSDKTSLKDATQAKEALEGRFRGYRTGLLHGRMKPEEKKRVMGLFRANEIRLLVATTIIEVGIDIPNANILVVENAERFGLSQLHQLRGRIGRGASDATCILFSETTNPLTSERLRAFCSTESGFELAEEDLKLRGPGDFFGERQHGVPELRIGNLITDISILETARKEAQSIAQLDPKLEKPEHALLKSELGTRYSRFRRSA